MRKQKATVWSERAQLEDPRLLAAQRQAKMRAAQEVVGGPAGYYGQRRSGATQVSGSASGSFAGGVRSKIRHHGAQKAVSYNPVPGAGVPMRLSANEVDEGSSDDEQYGAGAWHRRTGSGRSSLASERRNTGPMIQQQSQHARDSGGAGGPSPLSGSGQGSSPTETATSPLNEETPQPYHSSSYFASARLTQTTSSSSGGSRENSFGQLGSMPEKSPAAEEEERRKRKSTADDLIRRGSVDERSMTMSGVRLFVANPDID